jgi:replication factor A1
MFPITEFERENGKGKVASMMITDGTERRLALWDDNTKWVSRTHEGDTIKIEGAYIKKNRDNLELNLGWRGRLILNPENAPELPDIVEPSERTTITDLHDGDKYKELRATIVRVFPPTLFEVCSKCGAKAEGTHCNLPTKKTLVVNAELDDGTGIIRGTLFRENAEQFLGINGTEYESKPNTFNEEKYTGKEMLFRGQVKHNDMYNRKEFIIRSTAEVNVNKEIESFKTVN